MIVGQILNYTRAIELKLVEISLQVRIKDQCFNNNSQKSTKVIYTKKRYWQTSNNCVRKSVTAKIFIISFI